MGKSLTFDSLNENIQKKLNSDFLDFMDVIKWSFQEFGDRILYSCSFGAEAIVLIDLIAKINPRAKIVFLDTGLHFKETYALIEKVKRKYKTLQIKMVKPALTVKEQAEVYGPK